MLNTVIQHWRKLDHEGEHCPKARSSHAAVCLDYGGDYPQVLVTGGDGGGDEVVSDAWMLDVQSGNWVCSNCLEEGGAEGGAALLHAICH